MPRIDHELITRDNLEFLQWMKRFWDTNYGGQGYDAEARRKGVAVDAPATLAPIASSSSKTVGAGARVGGRTPLGGARIQESAQVAALNTQVADLSQHLEGLEKERDFYFEKVCFVFCVFVALT